MLGAVIKFCVISPNFISKINLQGYDRFPLCRFMSRRLWLREPIVFSLEHFRWPPISQWRSQKLQETLQSSGVNPETGLTDREAVVHSAFQSLNKVAIVSEGKLAQQNRNTDK